MRRWSYIGANWKGNIRMGVIPLTITLICYSWVAFDAIRGGNYPMAIVFIAYAAANLGFMWALQEN